MPRVGFQLINPEQISILVSCADKFTCGPDLSKLTYYWEIYRKDDNDEWSIVDNPDGYITGFIISAI